MAREKKSAKSTPTPQVLGQCRLWLRENFPGVEQIAMSSTSAAALRAAEEAEQGAAALGSELSGRLHGLRVMEANVQDKANNTTRFAVIGMQQTQPTAHDRSTICFKVLHAPGTLVEVLQHFSDHRINLLCIDSRPTRDTPWEYLFYVDVEGHRLAEPLRSCLEELKAICPVCKVLGSYPKTEPPAEPGRRRFGAPDSPASPQTPPATASRHPDSVPPLLPPHRTQPTRAIPASP